MGENMTKAASKDNGQLKTNTALQMEAAKIEFKVI